MLGALAFLWSVALAGNPVVEEQHLEVAFAPAAHQASVTARLLVRGKGSLHLRLIRQARTEEVLVDGRAVEATRAIDGSQPTASILTVPVGASPAELVIRYDTHLEEDVAAGEAPGRIHNKSVQAHVGEEGIFLADGAAWHPQPLGEDGHAALHAMSIRIEPMEGWALVASGEPAPPARGLDQPVWSWRTPRPVDGLAIAGGRRELHGRVHETAAGPVEIVMLVPPEHAELAPMFLDAVSEYLDLYTPLLGPFPYTRFSIVENFFSSGFAYPGFTLLGPRVVAMAPRSLAPGYLDHELVHNWWGNGVYVDPADGNWCEALTSFCANYYRRIVEDGEEGGLAWRRGTLMKLSTDPTRLDDGPLGAFGSDDGPGRFVGYDKGTFFFIMLTGLHSAEPDDATGMWKALRSFAEANLGRRAGWDEIQAAFEQATARSLDGMFKLWVRRHTVPRTISGAPARARDAFAAQYEPAGQPVSDVFGGGAPGFELDPRFMLYRVLPPDQLIPTIAGTTGAGGLAVEGDRSRPEVQTLLRQVEVDPAGENLLVIGEPRAETAELIRRAADSIILDVSSFSVGGVTYDKPEQSVLHTLAHPGRPGRFISVFHANGEAGWSHLPLIMFYTRDTTVVWDGRDVIARRVYEPDRRIVP